MANVTLEVVDFPVVLEVNLKLQQTGKREDGFQPPVSIHIRNLSAEQLGHLCDNFRKNVFALANLTDPKGE